MASRYQVAIQGKTPYGEVDGQAYCIWRYLLTAVAPAHFANKIGVGVSANVDIKDPTAYPEVVDLRGTFLDKSSNQSEQYVYIEIPIGAVPPSAILLCFIAPSAEDSGTTMTLQTRAGGDLNWTSLAFDVDGQSDGSALVHKIRGPASGVARPQPALQPILPYASEPFGVYQALLGWRSNLSLERIAAATANRFTAAARQISGAADISIQAPIGSPQTRLAVDRTGTSVGVQLAAHMSSLEATDYPNKRWSSILSKSVNSVLASITEKVITRLGATDTPQSIAPANRAIVRTAELAQPAPRTTGSSQFDTEAATATLLRYVGENNPAIVETMFRPTIAPWERSIGAAAFFVDGNPARDAFLSPIGILHLFREYFFELGTFLGPPVGHVWLSPGGTVELMEVNTRKQLVEQTIEQSTQTIQKTDLSQTQQDELSDAVKTENANDTKLGVTATASGGVAPVFQASGTASLNLDMSRKDAQEQTHKQMREQSTKLSSEVRQNYKTTFRTITETTDTSSRRYVLQNTTDRCLAEHHRPPGQLRAQPKDAESGGPGARPRTAAVLAGLCRQSRRHARSGRIRANLGIIT
jgi:hypothetical protein